MTAAANLAAADSASRRRRIMSAATVGVIHALIGYAFLIGLGAQVPLPSPDSLKLFDVLPDPPPPPVRPSARQKTARHEGAASPRNLRSKPTEIVAPKIDVPIPPPIIAAPIAGAGAEASAGASSVRGPGSGAGGQGNGTGSGSAGVGDGDGGIPLRWRSGRIKDSDYPRAALAAGIGGTVQLRFTVGVAGRVTDCTVTQSSGNAELDETTCRLIMQRFRYTPTTDASGRRIPDVVTGEHAWTVYRPDDPPGD